MTPLLEADLRRKGFQADSAPVVLADGQTWFLPRPYVELVGRFEGGKLVTMASETHFGPEFDKLMEDIFTEEGHVRYSTYFALTAFLLRWNYDITDDHLAVLIRHRRNDEASIARITAVLDIAQGIAPKAEAAGDASPA